MSHIVSSILVSFGGAVSALLWFGWWFSVGLEEVVYMGQWVTCPWHLLTKQVVGTSMVPVLHPNDEVLVCVWHTSSSHMIDRNDIVLYDAQPLNIDVSLVVKRVVGVPWDTWEYDGKNIFINHQLLYNTWWEPYVIDSSVLTLYARDYPVIPRETFLILGEVTTGSEDSSQFGLVAWEEILGKVLTIQKNTP